MEEKKSKAWDAISDIKKELVSKIVEAIGGRTIDVSEAKVYVFGIEHNSNEGVWGVLTMLSPDGFTLDFDGIKLPWRDMIVEDLAMVYDYLLTGKW